jgi:hypothetical protein
MKAVLQNFHSVFHWILRKGRKEGRKVRKVR